MPCVHNSKCWVSIYESINSVLIKELLKTYNAELKTLFKTFGISFGIVLQPHSYGNCLKNYLFILIIYLFIINNLSFHISIHVVVIITVIIIIIVVVVIVVVDIINHLDGYT